MSYETRILNRTNFYLRKYMLRIKSYPNSNTYRKWIDKLPPFPFRYKLEQVATSSTSASSGGNITPTIIITKKRQRSNLWGVIKIKKFMVTQLTKEPHIDQLACCIAVYTIHQYQNPTEKPIKNNKINYKPQNPLERPTSEAVAKLKANASWLVNRDVDKPNQDDLDFPQTESTTQVDNKIDIKLSSLNDDDDDWEKFADE